MSIDDVADDVADDGSVAASHFRPSWPTQAAWSWRRVAALQPTALQACLAAAPTTRSTSEAC